jgi:hypothetical protein
MSQFLGRIRNRVLTALSLTATTSIITVPAQALTFNFIAAEGTSTEIINAFNLASEHWSSAIKDDIILNIAIGQEKIADGSLGYATPTTGTVKATDFLTQLQQDATSDYDATALVSLPINDSGFVTRSIDGTLDASVRDIWLTSANAKALGLLAGNSSDIDSEIVINSDLAWDYDGDSQIAADRYDLVTTITHELGHALGIVSAVDLLDYDNFDDVNLSPQRGAIRDVGRPFRLTPQRGAIRDVGRPFRLTPQRGAIRDVGRPFRLQTEGDNALDTTASIVSDTSLDLVSNFDLFRYSATSAGTGAIDMTLSKEEKYFSIDGGVNALVALAKGESIDGAQASHTLATDNIMNPYLDLGIVKTISELDRTILDVMGWDFVGTSDTNYNIAGGNFILDSNRSIKNRASGASTPEPSAAIALLGVGLLTSFSLRKHCRHS